MNSENTKRNEELLRADRIRNGVRSKSVLVIAKILNVFVAKSWDYHDRYLFVDDRVFAVGASLSYHREPRMTTAISEIQRPLAGEFLRERFDEMWTHNDAFEILNETLNP